MAALGMVGWRLTDYYGTPRYGGKHQGLDLAGPYPGSRPPVQALAGGPVEFVGYSIVSGRNGWHVGVRDGAGRLWFYGHLENVRVRAGQRVATGDTLGDMGRSGLSSTAGVHLHLEVWADPADEWSTLDPWPILQDLGFTWDGWKRWNPFTATGARITGAPGPTINTASQEVKRIMATLDAEDRAWLAEELDRLGARTERAAAEAVEAVQSAPLYDADEPGLKFGPAVVQTRAMVRQIRDHLLPHMARGFRGGQK